MLPLFSGTVDVSMVSGIAETGEKASSGRLLAWLSIVFVLGNLVFTNIFLQFMGLIGLTVGIGVSGSLTLTALFVMRRRAGPAESSGA